MRHILAYIEGLAPTRFILHVGLVGGAIQGIPPLFVRQAGRTAPHLADFAVVTVAAIVGWTAALLLWWIAVRRRRWSIWITAGQLTLGLAFADLLTSALGMVDASIETNGMFAHFLLGAPLNIVESNVGLTLIRAPIWFLGSAIAIALGRHLSVQTHSSASSPSTTTHPEAVT